MTDAEEIATLRRLLASQQEATQRAIARAERAEGEAAAFWTERDAARADVERLTRERDFTRDVISKCADALGNGAYIGRNCSDAFRALLPSEIGLYVASLTEEKDVWKERATEAASRAEAAERKLAMAVEVIDEYKRAIGDHYAPNDCYATGPVTGDPIRDLVECPACSALAKHEKFLSELEKDAPPTRRSTSL